MAKLDPRKKPNWANIDGTSGDDPNIQGTGSADLIHGLEGNDTIFGNAGNDEIYGDDGNDVLNGGTDYDILHGGIGNDTLNGGNESGDQLFGEDGNDSLTNIRGTLVGGIGDDNYFVATGVNIVEALGEGFDTVFVKGSFTLLDG